MAMSLARSHGRAAQCNGAASTVGGGLFYPSLAFNPPATHGIPPSILYFPGVIDCGGKRVGQQIQTTPTVADLTNLRGTICESSPDVGEGIIQMPLNLSPRFRLSDP